MSEMRAWRVSEFCEPEDMAFETVARPEPGPGQALVKVHAAALNFLDILMIQGKYQLKPDFPFTPGCELSGEIVATGPGSNLQGRPARRRPALLGRLRGVRGRR